MSDGRYIVENYDPEALHWKAMSSTDDVDQAKTLLTSVHRRVVDTTDGSVLTFEHKRFVGHHALVGDGDRRDSMLDALNAEERSALMSWSAGQKSPNLAKWPGWVPAIARQMKGRYGIDIMEGAATQSIYNTGAYSYLFESNDPRDNNLAAGVVFAAGRGVLRLEKGMSDAAIVSVIRWAVEASGGKSFVVAPD